MIFPVKFDLETAVRKAQGDADKYLRQLQTTIHSKPLAIDLKIANAGSGSLNEISKRMRDIVTEWNNMSEAERIASKTSGEYTDRAKKLIAEFARLTGASETYARSLQQIVAASRRAANEQEKAMEKQRKTQAILLANEKSIASITAKLKYWKDVMNSSDMGGKRFRKAAEEVRRLNQSLGEAQRNVNSLTGQFKKQDGYVSRLVKRLVVYAGFQQINNFLTSVRSVTAEFELQRISLGAIIQDQAKANALFSEIKNFALKSPIKILDLTKYTKQLAAYKIGVNELFDTTKRLADISTGIGVSMDRLILLYGQVRATGYLRGCLGKGTSVKMFDGSNKKVEDVIVGDAIMGDDGQKRNVLSLVRNRETMYIVKYDGGSFRCNESHILTLYNINSDSVEDVYVLDYLKCSALYKGVKCTNGEYEYFDMSVERDCEDDYFGFEIDGNKRFIIEGNIVTHNSEVRQATEAGIPLVEELANKLSEANGTLVTSAQVLKMVEERAISFEMVKEVFEDMTNAGGLFYDMQEKQGNTLYGMWQKLGDAAAMMYDEIGNTPWVNEGMKEAINMLRTLMIEWKRAGANIATLGVAMLLYANKTKLATLATKLNTAANTEGSTALRGRILHLKKAIMYQNLFATSTTTATTATKLFTLAQLRLTQALNLVVVGFKKLSAAFMSNIWGIALVGLSLLIEHLIFAKDQAKELKNELANINLDYESKQGQDAANLEYLANAAVNAAKGSKAQKDALEELKNTYGKIIPMELLTIENLERMKGNYGELIALIDEYNLKQKYEKETSAIESSFAPKEEERANKIRNILREGLRLDYADEATGGVFDKVLDLSERNIQRFLLNLKKYADEGLDKKEQIIRASADLAAELGLNEGETEALTNAMIDLDRHELEGQGTLMDYTEALHQKHEAMEEVTNDYEKQKKALNEYSAVVDEVLKKNEDEPEVTANKDEFENEKARLNNQISDVARGIVELLNKANVAVDNGTQQILNTVIQNGGMIPDAVWDILEKAAEAANNPKLLAAIQDLRKHYKGLAPDNQTVNFIKDRMAQIVSTTGLKMKEFRQYLWDGQGDIKTYQENLQKSINTLRAQAFEMIKLNALIDAGLAKGQKYDVKEIQTLQAKADALQQLLDTSVTPLVMPDDKKSKSHGGTKSDPRLQNLKEEISLYEKLYQEYKQYEKAVGSSKAAEYMEREAKATIDALAEKYGIGLPKNVTDLTAALEILYKKMQALPSKVFKNLDKELKEFRWKIEKVDIDESQKNIEAELKRLADRISRTKTAKEFYEKILEQTGDINIATRVSMSIYGSTGEELFNDTVEQIREAFKTGSEEHPIDLDISAAIDLENQRIDYKKLADIYDKYQDEIIEKRRDTAKKIATEGQKEVATDILNWRKSLAKAKSYEQKRTDIINTATAERAKIIRETTDPKERGELLGLSYSKQAQELAKLAVDEFKSSDDYIKVFQDLDRVSTQTLDRMKKRLEEMIATVKDTENVEGLKTLVEQLDKIKEERETRNPIEGIIDSFKEYAKARKDYRTAEAEEAAAKAEFAQQEVGLNQAIQTAKAEQAIAQQRVNDLKAQGKENTSEGVAAELALNEATKKVTQATENRNKAVKKVNNAEQETTDALDTQKAALAKLQKNVNAMANAFNSAASSIKTIADMMGIAEDSELGDIVNGLVDGLNNAATIMTTILAIAIAIEAACWWMLAIGAAVAAFSAIGSWLTGSKVRKANKEIERQQKLLDQLEYTYGRLEKAADKAFGTDYVNNYQQQIKNLQAQQTAYLKQAEAERSKGKKKDKEKIKEYEEQARETADKIKELQDDLVTHFTGSSRTDAARQMAKSWIDARASMSDTFAAIKGDYQDLIKNMIVEGAAARVIENALTPVWDSMEKMLEKNDVQGAIDSLIGGMDSALNAANNGMEVLWQALEAKGYDMKKLIGDTDSEYTGIAKSVAGATSEEINNVAAIGNTLMYYVSPIPRIDENLARVVAIMEGRAAALPTASGVTTGAVDYTDLFNTANQHLSSLPRMEQHLAEIHTMLGRVIVPRGNGFVVNTALKN